MSLTEELIKYIMSLPYKRVIELDENGVWFAQVVEFPGCMTAGKERLDAEMNLNTAMYLWIRSTLTQGEKIIPQPFATLEFTELQRKMHEQYMGPKVTEEELKADIEAAHDEARKAWNEQHPNKRQRFRS